MRALTLAFTTSVVAGCAPYARPLPEPYRATVAAFYSEPPRADAAGGYRADIALDRWVDDRFVVGVDITHAAFTRTRGREASALGAGLRAAYVLDLAEIQPRIGVRVAAERWILSESDRATTPAFLSGFAAFDWVPRDLPLVLGAEVHSSAIALAGTTLVTPSFAYGIRCGHVF